MTKTNRAREVGLQVGFDAIGFARAGMLGEEKQVLETWTREGKHGEMSYMANHSEKRVDPRLLVEGCKTVISVMVSYHPGGKEQAPGAPVVAKYAYGKDYHELIKSMLHEYLDRLRDEFGLIEGRAFVDTAPVLERAWGKHSGTGWIGKNTCLIHPKLGSFVLLGELIVDLELEPDQPERDRCGTCTRCIDACPTGAITAPYQLDATRCISYYTIEHKGDLPAWLKPLMNHRVFGCDICQDVCPWNKKALPGNHTGLEANPRLLAMGEKEWRLLDEETYQDVFRGSAVKRAKFTGLRRNIDFLGLTDEFI
jgi:epoxyqueuosine reductase